MSDATHKGIEPKCATCGNTVNLVIGRPCPVCDAGTVRLFCLDHEGWVDTVPCPVCSPRKRPGVNISVAAPSPNNPPPAPAPAPPTPPAAAASVTRHNALFFVLGVVTVSLAAGLMLFLTGVDVKEEQTEQPSGTADGRVVAVQKPTPTPAPEPTPTPSPSPSATPLPSPTAQLSPTAAPPPSELQRLAASALSRPGSSPGERATMTVNGVEFAFRWCPPGTFDMGRRAKRRSDDEAPLTQVSFSRGFWMGETELSQAQWKAVRGQENNPSWFKGDTRPVEMVSWNDLMGEQTGGQPTALPGSFLAALQAAVRNEYPGISWPTITLPTEAQWEYACRAGTREDWSFGRYDDRVGEFAWYGSNSDARTQPVGTAKANPWGLHDMHGNVWEWTSSWLAEYPGGSVQDYAGGQAGRKRVIRGGSWVTFPLSMRSGGRSSGSPGFQDNGLGFRVVLSPSAE